MNRARRVHSHRRAGTGEIARRSAAKLVASAGNDRSPGGERCTTGSAPPRQTFSSSSCFIRRLFMHVLLCCAVATTFSGAVAGAFISGINFFCVCEQVAFRINGFHTRPSMAEQALNARVSAILLGSFLLSRWYFVNVAGLVISTIVMHSWLRAIGP